MHKVLVAKVVVGGVEFRHFYYTQSGRPDSLQVRVSEIEDRLGIFYVSVRGVRSSQVKESMSLACQELFDPSVSCDSFSVVQVLDSRNPGVLLCVASLDLKHGILGCKNALKCRG